MAMTLAEKILASRSGKKSVRPGDLVTVRVDVAMAHEACAQLVEPFEKMGATRIWDLDKVVIPIDHWVPAGSEQAARMHQTIRAFVAKYGIKHFYDIGRQGICHQILAEKGFSTPGKVVLGTDSHTNTVGALGTFAAGVGPTEMAAVFATGELWMKVPPHVRIHVDGRLQPTVSSKDIVLAALGELTCSGARYKAVEWTGSTIQALPMWQRLTLTNMTTEMGAKTGIIAPDAETIRYLSHLDNPFPGYVPPGKAEIAKWQPDPDAVYEETLVVKGSELGPLVAKPFSPDNVAPIEEVEGTKLDQVFIGSCTNARFEDLQIVADIVRGETVPPHCRVLLFPASTDVYNKALKAGLFQVFADAGISVNTPGCGACFGAQGGILGPGEVCASTSNRNFVGRMGHKESQSYLMSPASAAASAVYGAITDPRKFRHKLKPVEAAA